MIFFNIKTDKTAKEVEEVLSRFLDSEEHHPLISLWDNYYDARRGLHTYIDGERVSGYFEDGKRTRFGGLRHDKAWFWGRLRSGRDGVVLSGVIASAPPVWVILTAVLVTSFFYYLAEGGESIVPFIGTLCFFSIFVFNACRDEETLREALEEIIK